jgi:signal transduction histidine kinase/ActR/RegA family two-component response regulator
VILGLCFDPNAVGAPFTHDRALVALSFAVAVIGSYTALELAERLRGARGGAGSVWHAASAIVLGASIWAMHFIAMLAFETPLERGYDLGLTALSALVAIAVVGIGLWIVRGNPNWFRLSCAGIVVGAGVVAMHYTGMAALRVAGQVYYAPSLFAASVVVALAAATVALWLAFTLKRWWLRAGAAFVMAIAICGMHYTGMAATAIVAGLPTTPNGVTVSEPILAAAIALGVFAIVIIGLVGAFYDRRREVDAILEAARLRAEVAKRTEELRATAQQLDSALARAERASASKSDFLASMSHELRTPLNSILGFSELLQTSKTFEPLTTKQAGAVKQIEQAGRHLLYLIDDILDLSRIEAGRLSLSIEPVDVAQLIEETTAMLQPTAIAAGVTIHTDAAFGGVVVKADRRRLQQVLINLVSNGVKYNKRGGRVNVGCRQTEGGAQIAVSDTGIGIPQRFMDEVFEPFNRLGQENSEIGGYGVGLALCKRLVEAMRGEITANSVEGEGSTFALTLPLASAYTLSHAEATGATATVLYIEDNPANILLMRHVIKEVDGVDLVVATHPSEGIELARRMQPALILLDINLPEMDGFEVLRILKSDDETAHIPVFALTANAMPREVERGKAAGFDRYFTKPLKIAYLVEAIEIALSAPAVQPVPAAPPPAPPPRSTRRISFLGMGRERPPAQIGPPLAP